MPLGNSNAFGITLDKDFLEDLKNDKSTVSQGETDSQSYYICSQICPSILLWLSWK